MVSSSVRPSLVKHHFSLLQRYVQDSTPLLTAHSTLRTHSPHPRHRNLELQRTRTDDSLRSKGPGRWAESDVERAEVGQDLSRRVRSEQDRSGQVRLEERYRTGGQGRPTDQASNCHHERSTIPPSFSKPALPNQHPKHQPSRPHKLSTVRRTLRPTPHPFLCVVCWRCRSVPRVRLVPVPDLSPNPSPLPFGCPALQMVRYASATLAANPEKTAKARGEYLRTHFKNMREVGAALTGAYPLLGLNKAGLV